MSKICRKIPNQTNDKNNLWLSFLHKIIQTYLRQIDIK